MSAQNRSTSGVATGVLGLIGMSALAGILVTAAVTPALAVTGIAANSGISMFENLPGYLEIGDLSEKTDVYATNADGSTHLLASFYEDNREEVGWDQISQYAKDAAVAGEDPRFYEHGGIDVQGTVRAALNEYVIGGATQGGSSITQQYVKNVLVNNAVRKAKTEEEKEAAVEAAIETTPERKLKEMKYAISLEKKTSKDEILRGYLNIALFGGRVYGIQSASQYYYSKNAADLTLPEAASLIAIVNNPEKFRLDNPESESNGANTVDSETGEVVPYAATKERRDYILDEMLKYGKITQEDHDAAIATPIAPAINPPSTGCQTAGSSAYFCDYVKNAILNYYDDPTTTDIDEGQELLNEGGLQVFTSIDLELQAKAQQAIDENVPYVDDRFDVGSVAVTVQPGTGRILAMAQNKHYSQEQAVLDADRSYSAINMAAPYDFGGSSGFQPGSTFKVFTLGEWLNEGHSLRESFNGNRRPISKFPGACSGGAYTVAGGFNPKNDDATIANNAVDATKYSVNSSFMAMAEQLQLCGIKNTAQAFGVYRADGLELGKRYAYNDDGTPVLNPDGSRALDPDFEFPPSAVLGTEEVAPVTMAAAFAGIANNGYTCSPIAIDKILTKDGEEIPPPPSTCQQSVTPEVAHAMEYAMAQTFNGGTASASNTGTGVPHIGKTGTTDYAYDTWMIGSSTTAATAVWVGNITGGDNRTNLRNVSFDSGAAATARHRIWPMIMELADNKYGGAEFPEPDASAFKQVLVDVPQVAGLTFDAAKQALEAAGFVVEDGGQQDSNLPAGQVTGTDPAGQAGRGATIRVFTSNGQGTTVPDLTGLTEQAAKAALDQAGLKMKGNGGGNQVVTSQDPPAGTAARKGSTVTVQFGGDDDGGNGGTPPTPGTGG
ncbi:transglycosylase domain-containing protein [Agromyces larvae]|uniref:Transglycosylase domain-containing protein n=1 Tax=Agromyces larvae TaxID=2929802 RepID=A0ABY4BYN3_9MICO|nr:transglycosylase domain-containing protein [Agromyces larvae]UOE44346.1 transglycosylase domain-containing protein [Agromyces larvae]